jgi:hypothetical protein
MTIIDPSTPPSRECGGCTLCCKLIGVPDLHKPANKWCEFATKGAGCKIHSVAPKACGDWRCLWLDGFGPIDWRPDKIHGAVSGTLDGENIVIYEDAGYRGDARRALEPFIRSVLARGRKVFIVCGESRRMLANTEEWERLCGSSPA